MRTGILNTLNNLQNARNQINNARQKVGNFVDRVGTGLRLPEANLSELISGGKQTTYTGTTPQSQNAGFIRNTGGNTALNTNNTNPQIMKQIQQQNARNIQGQLPAPAGTPSFADFARRDQINRDNDVNTDNRDTGGFGGFGSGGSSQSNVNAEQERINNDFRNRLGNEYSELRNKFGSFISDAGNLLNELPAQLRQLNAEYKSAIGEKQGSELKQVGTQRESVQADQRKGILGVKEDVARSMREVGNRLANAGAGSSSAKEFFARAIQQAGNEQTKKVIEQAANNYALLDNEEKKIKSNYQTLLDELDREEQTNITNINRDIPSIKASVDEALRKSGEYETLDKEGLTNKYLAELMPLYERAKGQTEAYRRQLESWKTDNENKIGALRNQIIQDFTPRQITVERLNAIQPNQNLGNEQDLTQPNALLQRARRLREQEM